MALVKLMPLSVLAKYLPPPRHLARGQGLSLPVKG